MTIPVATGTNIPNSIAFGTRPQDWTVDDIYALQVSLKGRPMAWSVDNGSFTITSEGEDIYNYSDEFRLVYKTLKGDGSIVARIDSIEGVDPWSLAGVMIRSGLDPADKFLMVCETAENGIRFRKRATANISVVTDSELLDEENTSVTEDQLAQMQEQITLNAPYWIKLERSGHVFSGYTSPDGSTWTPMAWGEHTVAMSTNTVYIGLAVCSHSSGVFSTAESPMSHSLETSVVTGKSSTSVWTRITRPNPCMSL